MCLRAGCYTGPSCPTPDAEKRERSGDPERSRPDAVQSSAAWAHRFFFLVFFAAFLGAFFAAFLAGLFLAAFFAGFLAAAFLAGFFLAAFLLAAGFFAAGLGAAAGGDGVGGGANGSIGVGAGSIHPESDQLISISCSSAMGASSRDCRGATPAAGEADVHRPPCVTDDKMHFFVDSARSIRHIGA